MADHHGGDAAAAADGRRNQYQLAGEGSSAAGEAAEMIKEQDRLLPIANVGRIMKQILPPNAKISKEAKETMQECVSEFISFVTGEASDKCHKEKRKTVNGDDVCWAFSALGFDDYVDPMRRYLNKYRELEGDRAAASAAASSSSRPAGGGGGGGGGGGPDVGAGVATGHFMFNAMDRTDSNTNNSRQYTPLFHPEMSRDLNFSAFSQMGRLQPMQSLPRAPPPSSSASGAASGMNGGQDNLLPIANVGRIMKDGLPPQAKISKRAKETIQECATEFISFVTGEASERCRRERRKTVNGDDICHAMRTLGLDHYADAMARYLQRYRESEELAASLNNSNAGAGIQIDVRAELSIFRGNQQQ
uniref:Transcription factor CBF/NF-Y/archaeal histone domain-containing protein n=1 Tax=Leersia perrieri TaxID=77586 RepID=A0A0D9V9Y7_9ORYZ